MLWDHMHEVRAGAEAPGLVSPHHVQILGAFAPPSQIIHLHTYLPTYSYIELHGITML